MYKSLDFPNTIWSVTGNEGGKNLFVQFAQNSFTSAKCVQNVPNNLKDEQGKYKQFSAETVKLDPTTGKPSPAKLFISGDQNPKTRACRYMCTKFSDAVKSLYPDYEWSYYDGVIQFSIDKVRFGLAIMLPTTSSVNRNMVQWDNKLVAEHGFDKVKILDKFDSLTSGPAAATGSCVSHFSSLCPCWAQNRFCCCDLECPVILLWG